VERFVVLVMLLEDRGMEVVTGVICLLVLLLVTLERKSHIAWRGLTSSSLLTFEE